MIDAAIVGLGWWGRNIVNAVQEKSDRLRFIVGVSKDPDSVRDFALGHRLDLSTEYDDALADPRVQAVVLATPHSLHPDQILAAAAVGKAVFCEKPLAFNKADAVRAVAACQRAGVVLGIGTNKRFWPSMRALKNIVASGQLGEILHLEGNYSNENSDTQFSRWRDLPTESPGGGMSGAGLHMLDGLISLVGAPRYVHARLVARRPNPGPRDTVSVLFEFANGVSGMLGTVRATPYYWRAHVFGSKGSAEVLGEGKLVLRLSGMPPVAQNFEPVDTLLAEFHAFADAVAGVAPYPIPTEEMVATVAAFEAVVNSIESGRTVLLDGE